MRRGMRPKAAAKSRTDDHVEHPVEVKIPRQLQPQLGVPFAVQILKEVVRAAGMAIGKAISTMPVDPGEIGFARVNIAAVVQSHSVSTLGVFVGVADQRQLGANGVQGALTD